MGAPIDVVTDQTSAHDPLTYLPRGVAFEDMAALRAEDPAGFTERARQSMAAHVEAMVGFMDARRRGVRLRQLDPRRGASWPGTRARSTSPASCPPTSGRCSARARGPFRWAALSGDPADIAATDAAILDLFPDNEPLARWIRMAQEKVHFQGLPARICWLGYGERNLAGLRFNELVARGDVQAPIVLGRDHLDCGSVASPYRETEAMADGSDAIADWPLLNALVNTASGASWVSIHHGGGVGIGRSIHAGQVCVADGTAAGRGEAGAGAHQRPGDGRDPARGRRVRRGGRGGRAAGRARPDAAVRPRRAPVRRSRPCGSRCCRSAGTPGTGGYRRYSWTPADLDCRAWFEAAARDRQLRLDPDRNGNLWAWWDVSGSPAGQAGRAIATGSHLDSVPDGGAYDGPLGVVSAFAAIDELRAGGFVPSRPDRGGRVHRGGRGPVRGRLPGQPPADRRDRPRAGPGAARRRRDHAGRARCRRPGRIPARSAATRTCSPSSAATWSCTSSRAAAWPTSARPSASPRGSGRTAGGGSTSPGRLTTRARPRWPTGAIR